MNKIPKIRNSQFAHLPIIYMFFKFINQINSKVLTNSIRKEICFRNMVRLEKKKVYVFLTTFFKLVIYIFLNIKVYFEYKHLKDNFMLFLKWFMFSRKV